MKWRQRAGLATSLLGAVGCGGVVARGTPSDAGASGDVATGGQGGRDGGAGDPGDVGGGALGSDGGAPETGADAFEEDAAGGCPTDHPVLLASGVAGGTSIAVYGAFLYFHPTNDADNVWRLPRCGGTSTAISSGGQKNTCARASLGVDATGVYWSTGDSSILSAPIAGGARATLATGEQEVTSLTADGSNVYWTTSYGKVRQVPVGGGTVTKLANGPGNATTIAVDGTHVYWMADAQGSNPGGLISIPIGGGSVATVVTGADQQDPFYGTFGPPGGVAVDGTSVYWTNGSTVMKVALGGGVPTTLASGQEGAAAIAVDGESVYWTLSPTGDSPQTPMGAVVKVAVGGGTPITLATGQDEPLSIAVDETSVYWETGAGCSPGGTIMKGPK